MSLACLPLQRQASQGLNNQQHLLLAAFRLPGIVPAVRVAADHEAVSGDALEAVPGEALEAAPGNALEAADKPVAASAGASGTALCASGVAAVPALARVHQLVADRCWGLQ